MPEHAGVTNATLMCMVDKLTRLMSKESAKESTNKMRCAVDGESYRYYRSEHADGSLLSEIVGEGVIYEEFCNRPRLLCEDLDPSIDKTKLICAAFSFFFPNLVRSSSEPGALCLAFENDLDGRSAYCYQVRDDSGYTVLIIFGFEVFEEISGQINLLLLGKFQLVTESLEVIWGNIKLIPPDGNPNVFANNTATYVRELTKNRAELALIDVMSHGVGGKPFQTYITKILWPQTELTRLIQSMERVVYDYRKSYFTGVVVCAGLRSVQEAISLIPHAIREISRFIDADDYVIEPAYNSNRAEFSELCWKATKKTPVSKTYMYCFELQCPVLWKREYSLIMREIEMGNISFETILTLYEGSSDFERAKNTKDRSVFCCNIMYQAKKEMKRLRDIEKKIKAALKAKASPG